MLLRMIESRPNNLKNIVLVGEFTINEYFCQYRYLPYTLVGSISKGQIISYPTSGLHRRRENINI
jgi:hypothetical protein